MNNKKILFVMPGLNGGGAERVVSQIAGALSKKQYKVRIVLTEDQTCVYPLDENIEVNYIGKQMPHPFEQIAFIRRNIKDWHPATVISFLDNQNIFTAISLLDKKIRFIVSERNDPSKVGRFRRFLKELFYHRADQIVFQTDEAKRFYPNSLQKRGIVILNPIKEDLPSPCSGNRRRAFVAYSRLTSQKNIPMMLRAFRDFNKTCPGYTLEIYGKGAIEGSLKQMAKDMQIDSMVTFCGFCSDVHARIRDASAYLSSSDYEGLSNSMIEAMGLGLPVICTDCPIGGAKMVIQDGVNGILVPVNDHQAMASAMLRLIKEPSLGERMSDNAVKIKDMLNLKNVIDKWEEIL